MKKVCLIVLSLIMLLVFSGCCLSHEWVEASCAAPKTCSKCAKTEGEPLSHQWKEATCTAPKTCTSCGLTEGGKLPHKFGKEEIEPDYVQATALLVRTCGDCGEQRIRSRDLEKLANMGTFLLTPEEFSERFTNMLMDMQAIFGKDQYFSFLSDETASDTLKLYMAKRDSEGTVKIVGEFAIYDPDGHPLLPQQKNEEKSFWKIRGTVKDKKWHFWLW